MQQKMEEIPQYGLCLEPNLAIDFDRIYDQQSIFYSDLQSSSLHENLPIVYQSTTISQSLQLSCAQYPLQQIKRGSRKVLNKEKIQHLSQLLKEYQSLTTRQRREQDHTLKKIAQKMQMGYSTLLRKHRQFKKGQKLSQSSKQNKTYNRTKMTMALLQKNISKKEKFTCANDIINHLRLYYGLQYHKRQINKLLKKMGYCKNGGVWQSSLPDKIPQPQLCSKYLLQGLIQRKQPMIYFGQYTFTFDENQQIIMMILMGQDGIISKIFTQFNKQIFRSSVDQIISEYVVKFSFNTSKLWYLVTGHEEVVQKEKQAALIKIEENNFFVISNKFNGKPIILPPFCRQLNPIYILYQQMIFYLCKFDCSFVEARQLMNKLLNKQITTSKEIITHFQINLVKQLQKINTQL